MTNLRINQILNGAFKDKERFIFVSPHLDDAIFSSGGLMEHLSKRGKNILIVNVFTKGAEPPYTLSAKRFLHLCGYTSAAKLFENRIKEDAEAAKKINAKVTNLGFTDALWRKKGKGSIIPELDYTYPIFRFSIARGLISKKDYPMIKRIITALKKNIKEDKKTIIFSPIGIGNHTDHIIVRNCVQKCFKNVIFWEDYPYINHSKVDIKFVSSKRLKRFEFGIDKKIKNTLINTYKSQVGAIFGKNKAITKKMEGYYSWI